jgi:aconitate hydratase
MPAGSKILPLRSNIPAMAEHVFERIDPDFPKRAREAGSCMVVAGSNYGQGSSREHAALAPMYLGLRAVLAKSFARIHWSNLVNFGILPLVFVDEGDYERIEQGDELEIAGVRQSIQQGDELRVRNVTQGSEFAVRHDLSPRQVQVVLAGGRLSYVKSMQA